VREIEPGFLPRDALLVCAAASLRSAAVSLVGVVIAIHLAAGGLSPAGIGLILGVGIAANALATVVVGIRADAWGRRGTLIALGLITGSGYVMLAFTHSIPVLLAVAVVGLVNGMGRDRGPASALEQALLPALTTNERRTWTMSLYNVAIDSGHAVGALGAALPTVFATLFALSAADAHTATFVMCGGALIAATIPYALLRSPVDERAATVTAGSSAQVDTTTRGVVRKLTLLFGIDSVGGGFLSSALVAYWFFERYGTTEVQLAWLFFAARVLNVVSHLAAAWIARRIGLLNTMVLTHLPSSVLLMLAPAAPSAALAAALFLAREALVEMDVPTRQSYVMAVVPPRARTYASGMTNVVRNAGWAVGPVAGGTVMQHVALAAPLFIGGTLKIIYDIALYRSFRHLHPPEEQERAAVT
jgi:predicted MFS family arabinose efflux permease